MEALRSSILRGRIGGSSFVIYSFGETEDLHGIGHKFAIICHQRAEFVASLHGHSFMPGLEGGTCISLRAKGNRPNIAGEIINYVHGVHISGTRSHSHRTTQINVHPF